MNSTIPSNNYLSLKKQQSLNQLLDNIFIQIEILKNHPCFDSKQCNFELEFRLRNKYTNLNVENFVKNNSCLYSEYSLDENYNTKYRIICNSQYSLKENETVEENKSKESKLFEYIKSNSEKEITSTLENKVEYTKKINLVSAYYFIFKIALNIETNLDTSDILTYLSKDKELIKNLNKESIEWSILNYTEPVLKERRSFIINNDVRLDMTYYDEKSQFEIDFSNNIYHDRIDMIKIIHNMIQLIDSSTFITDYLFMLLPNFEFQKPITPSFEILLNNVELLIKNTFYIAAKTDGLRKLLIIINNLMFSITENFIVEYIDEIEIDAHIVMDCEYINNVFIPFDIIYNDADLRIKSYNERINILNSLNFGKYEGKIIKKYIKLGKTYQDIQEFINSEMNVDIPNDGIIITDGKSTYFENSKVYKIKTVNTVDIEFNGRYFLAKKNKINKKFLNISLTEYKNICKLYNIYKKKKVVNDSEYYYHKQVEIINDLPYNKRIVKYYRINVKRIPFIIEFNLDTNEFVKVREDKTSSNSLNTFNSVLLASYQRINVDIFNPKSSILMRKYHNLLKNNILKKFKGNLLDIGSGNGGDIHKWKHFNKIFCVEPDSNKIKNLKERIAKSEIKNRITIINNKIQEVTLNEIFDIATCFFALNDLCYSDISDMLKKISKNINGIFIIVFFDGNLINEDIESPSIIYKKCITKENNKIKINIDESSPVYLISSLRYSHFECDNIMYVNINDSYLTNHYENDINSDRVINIFEKYGFKVKKQYPVDYFTFLDRNQLKYTSYINVIEFSNIEIP